MRLASLLLVAALVGIGALSGLAARLAAGPATGLATSAGAPQSGGGYVMAARTAGVSLVMVDEPGCTYCIRWNKEVGGGYARTTEGRAAPLRRVRRDSRVLTAFAPVIYTPTFILVRNGREVGRITGYPGQLHFWEELSQIMSVAGIGTRG